MDTMAGAAADFPIAGWGVTDTFARDNPHTIAAFQRAMAKAQQLAATDRTIVTNILPTYTKIDAKIAPLISLGAYPTTLNPIRLQRVADLMQANGLLTKRLDVTPMILAHP
jgi:NitT/TauT family transport system substrate-binding protein